MQMKSLLALSVLVSAVFLTGISNAQSTDDNAAAAQATEDKAADKSVSEAKEAATTAEPSKKASKPSKKKKHKRAHHKRHKHNRKHQHTYHPSSLEKRLAPHFIWSDHRAPRNNFLVGGSLSYAAQKTKFVTRYTAPALLPNPITIYTDHSEHLVDNGVLMGLFAGWQWRHNRFMAGIEASVDFDDFEKSESFVYQEAITGFNVIYGTTLYDRGDLFGFSGRLGYFVTPFFMPYVRLGAQFSRDEVNYQAYIGRPGVSYPQPDFSSEKRDVWGILGGVGAEFPTYIGGSTIRIEYNFVRTESIIIGDNTFPIIGEHKFRNPETHIGRVSWVWNFL